jgi:hypothetical protein
MRSLAHADGAVPLDEVERGAVRAPQRGAQQRCTTTATSDSGGACLVYVGVAMA